LIKVQRIAWAITGAGHNLNECAGLIFRRKGVDVFLSKAAEEVVRIYSLEDSLKVPDVRIYRETLASSPLVVRLFRGDYRLLVVAPATSNSVAKFVCGISDSLVSNMFAQAGKSRVPIIVMPTDLAPEMDSTGPHGEPVKVYPRPIDLENTAKLRAFEGVTVVGSVEEMEQCLNTYL
jgi:dihydromethanopterin reductase (acceptor)